jgi:hypothetical protein
LKIIDTGRLLREEATLAARFQSRTPFKYLVIDDFLHPDRAWEIYREYPPVEKDWIDVNGPHQHRKWATNTLLEPGGAAFFDEVNSDDFLELLGRITGIQKLLKDSTLNGAGYHQIVEGGFLNVHVDFNRLGDLHRRLNLIVYMNPDWQESFGGYLELWNMANGVRIENIAPIFNRCVLFETNEISYHGHPLPLKSGDTTRKSLSVYYYTAERDDIIPAADHTTVYVNTRGATGAARIAVGHFFNTFRRFSNARRRFFARRGSETDRRP